MSLRVHNRVHYLTVLCADCSIALQSTSIWTNAIGLEAHVNTNEEIERQINAPTFGGGGGRAARRAAAAEVVEATGAGLRWSTTRRMSYPQCRVSASELAF